MKKIVLITTGQPATNPRIVKEADALHAAGHEVTLLYSFFVDWATEKDTILLQNVPWKFLQVGGAPTDKKGLFILTRIRNKLVRILNKYIGNSFLLAERTQARAYDELLKAAKNIKADWYIGHNLGAIPIAVKAAKIHKAKAGFDFEDYHRGENLPDEKIIWNRIVYLENKYVPQLDYYSTASPMITAVTKKNHPNFKGTVITLLNCFPLAQQPPFNKKAVGDNSLQLCWFSQTIGINRGLEILIQAVTILNDPTIHLTLAGRCDANMLDYIHAQAGTMINNIHFAGMIQPEMLPAFVSNFDVGMAIELAVPENRDICLTNKIFTYLLAGNAIIVSETTMQKAFNALYNVGLLYPCNDSNLLAQQILLFKDENKLLEQRKKNYQLANQRLNWEMESAKLTALLYL